MALTKVSTPAIKDEAITLAKLLHGDSNSNGKFLRANNGADPTFETVNTDLVSDTSPQLGGDLASNGNDILFADNDKAVFGTGADLKIYHNGSHNYFLSSNGDYVFDTGSTELARLTSSGNLGIGAVVSGAASIGQDKLDIRGGGIYLNSQSTATSGAINKISFLKLHPAAPSVSYEQGRIEAYTENGYGAGGLDFYYGKSVGGGNYAATKGLRLDHKGNLALGGFATPTDLNSAVEPSLFIDSTTNSLSAEGAAVYLTQNAYFNNGGSYEYVNAAAASQYRQNAGGHSFLHAASGSAGANFNFTEKLRIDSDGLKLNGDTAAANALDDYEEGTWTPTLYFGSNNSGMTYASNSRHGEYTRIGNLVTFTFRFTLSNMGTSTGDAQIYGLPFQCAGGNGNYSGASFGYMGGLTNSSRWSAYQTPTIDTNQSYIFLRYVITGTNYSANHNNASFTNTTDLIGRGFYYAS